MDVEVNMRIPSLTIKAGGGAPAQTINNSGNRFTKMIRLAHIPKVGDPLQVAAGGDRTFDCSVTRSEWSDDRGIFIVSCSYAKRSIIADDYQALINDPDWTVKQLP